MSLIYDTFPEALESPGYLRYVGTLYGEGLRLDDALIEEDIQALSAFAARARGGRILDAGCGTGDLLRRLCADNAAQGLGIDPSPVCLSAVGEGGQAAGRGLLARACAITVGTAHGLPARPGRRPGLYGRLMARSAGVQAGKDACRILGAYEAREGDLRFQRARMEDADPAWGSFDLIVAVDSLGECPDPARAIRALLSLLAPGGAMMIAHTERPLGTGPSEEGDAGPPPPETLSFTGTSIAAALRQVRGGRRLLIRGKDLGRSEKLHWKLATRLLPALEEACAKEGLSGLYRAEAERVRAMAASVERDDSRRYWYCVEAP
jgi:SAM-dependent methyltransferase